MKRLLGMPAWFGLIFVLAACGGARPDATLKAPANVSAEPIEDGIRVRWEYAADTQDDTRFNVYRATPGAAFEVVTDAPLGGATRSYDDMDVTAGVSYRYAVTAVREDGEESPLVESAGALEPGPVPSVPPPSPPPGQVRLTVRWDASSTGKGRVTSSPVGIDCDVTTGLGCSATFAAGTAVTLTAQPEAGSSFGGWSGPCTGADPCRLTLTGDATLGATLRSARATLSVTVEGAGRVVSSPAGIDCGESCSESYPPGTTLSLSARPDAEQEFVGWGGACSGTGGCSVRLESNQAVTASFRRILLPTPVIRGFAASASVVRAGDSLTLTWQTEHAEKLTLSSNAGLRPTDVTGRTSYQLAQNQDATYTLEASNRDGKATRTVQVRVGRAPAITAFTAEPTVIGPGETATLRWSVTGDALTLTLQGVGDVSGQTSRQVTPTQTTTYRLTAANAYGPAVTRDVTVEVKPRRKLTVFREGGRQSAVTAQQGGIACGSVCEATYFEGTMVTLTAERHQDLEHWYICDSPSTPFFRWLGLNGCRQFRGKDLPVAMPRDRFVYAVFKN